jgi:hypothetical protein
VAFISYGKWCNLVGSGGDAPSSLESATWNDLGGRGGPSSSSLGYIAAYEVGCGRVGSGGWGLLGDNFLRRLLNFDVVRVLESKLLRLLADLIVEDENNTVEGRLKRSSLTCAEICCEDGTSVVLLVDTGASKVCLSVKLLPPLPVANLQRPPHGLTNMYPFGFESAGSRPES